MQVAQVHTRTLESDIYVGGISSAPIQPADLLSHRTTAHGYTDGSTNLGRARSIMAHQKHSCLRSGLTLRSLDTAAPRGRARLRFGHRIALIFAFSFSLLALEVAGGQLAFGHQSGCHGAHTCPSDKNPPTYLCGDNATGTCIQPNDPSPTEDPTTPQLNGPPTAGDCQQHPEYYTTAVCAFAATSPTPSASRTATASATPVPTPTATPVSTPPPTAAPLATARALPNNGAESKLMALAGLTLIEVGIALILVAAWFGSRRYRQRRAG